MLGQFTGQDETDGSLDLSARDGGLLVVVRKSARLRGDALEDVVHERVHDGHSLGGDASVGMDLTEDLVDVDGIGLLPGPPLLGLLDLGDGNLGGLLGGFTRNNFTGHDEAVKR